MSSFEILASLRIITGLDLDQQIMLIRSCNVYIYVLAMWNC